MRRLSGLFRERRATAIISAVDLATDAGARRALLLIRVLRTTLLVGCLMAAGVGWTLGSMTVVGLALVIAAEETWETSVVIAALRRQLRGTPLPACYGTALPPRRGSMLEAPRDGTPLGGHRS